MEQEELKVSKLISENPDTFEEWTLSRAVEAYAKWIKNALTGLYPYTIQELKSFSEWIETEI